MNKFIAKAKMSAVAAKIDSINPQKVTNHIIEGWGNMVDILNVYAEVVKAAARFYGALKENGKLRSSVITLIKEGKPIMRDVVLRVKDNDALLDSVKVIAKELEFEGSKLNLEMEKISSDFAEDLSDDELSFDKDEDKEVE